VQDDYLEEREATPADYTLHAVLVRACAVFASSRFFGLVERRGMT
jgi:hypothetical protein